MPPTLTLRAEVGHVSVIIENFTITVSDQARTTAAKITWEDRNYPNQVLFFEIQQDGNEAEAVDEACADAFLAACFPLAAIHGESRVQIESQPCPMLVEGLYTAHAWWAGWGGMAAPAPKIEPNAGQFRRHATGSRNAHAFLSGGVDGLHVLMCNRRLYRRGDPAYIRDALSSTGSTSAKGHAIPKTSVFKWRCRAFGRSPQKRECALLHAVPTCVTYHQNPASGRTGTMVRHWLRSLTRRPQGQPSCLSVEHIRSPMLFP